MNIPQIQIRQQYAKINTTTTPASLTYKQSKSTVTINQPKGDLQITQAPAKVQIDNYPMRNDLGFKNSADFVRDNAMRAQEIVKQAIARYAEQGDHLMAIHKGGNALMDVIEQNATPPTHGIGLRWVRGPAFNTIPAELKIRYTPNPPTFNVKKIPGDYRYNRGSVDTTIKQYQNVDIFLPGGIFDRQA